MKQSKTIFIYLVYLSNYLSIQKSSKLYEKIKTIIIYLIVVYSNCSSKVTISIIFRIFVNKQGWLHKVVYEYSYDYFLSLEK